MEKNLPRTVSPQPGIPTKSNPQPFERTHSNAVSFHLIPMNTDLSLEDKFSALVLPTDLSMDLESYSRVTKLECSLTNDERGLI